jgi:hypothetical protein
MCVCVRGDVCVAGCLMCWMGAQGLTGSEMEASLATLRKVCILHRLYVLGLIQGVGCLRAWSGCQCGAAARERRTLGGRVSRTDADGRL